MYQSKSRPCMITGMKDKPPIPLHLRPKLIGSRAMSDRLELMRYIFRVVNGKETLTLFEVEHLWWIITRLGDFN